MMAHGLQSLFLKRDDQSLFDQVWKMLHISGGCDRKGGVEYVRIVTAFRKTGMWGVLEEFILRRANRLQPPVGEELDELKADGVSQQLIDETYGTGEGESCSI